MQTVGVHLQENDLIMYAGGKFYSADELIFRNTKNWYSIVPGVNREEIY